MFSELFIIIVVVCDFCFDARLPLETFEGGKSINPAYAPFS